MGEPGGQYEPQRLFKGGKVEAQPSQSLSRAFALLDKTNKTPHPKSRKAVSIMTPVAGSAQKAKLKQLSTPAPQPQATVRPSASRLSTRAPRSSMARDFETPAPQGRRAHWDVGDVGDLEVEPDMDGGAEVGNDVRVEAVELDVGEEEIEYMPPTAIIPAYEPMFDMPDMKAFGKAVIGLTYSYWPQDDVDVLSTIRDEDVVDLAISQPEFHDLSSLQPPEDDPFPPKLEPAAPKPQETRGRSTSTAGRKAPGSAPHTRPVSVAAVRTVSSSGAPSRTLTRPVSVAQLRAPSAGSKPRVVSAQASKPTVPRPGTAPGIRPREGPARVAGKMMVPKSTQPKPTPVETHLVEALVAPVGESVLDDEFLFDV
ncbi:hypothetical protein BDV93DRAFT_602779 [Ceratobasidium sp. AG-I]|nr:hypothetical protein BDV93DRAFT_602779 [Ceratobasidium sp. AG-I]